MILRIEDLRGPCSTILTAVDSNEISQLTETLELKVRNNKLLMSVTNKEYYVRVAIDIGSDVDFHATVNANLFLKLIAQTTTDTIEFQVEGNSLIIKGNGRYKLPLIFEDDKLLELPEITLNNVTSEFNISGSILNSILVNNGKQIGLGIISKPVQKFYYVDENGALTFTSGACINNFKLDSPVKMLLNQRLVKLFKLFRNDEVRFKMSQDSLSEEIIQTKVSFESSSILVTAVISCDDTLMHSVPVNAIRARGNSNYPYSVVINRAELLETLGRLSLFSTKDISSYIMLNFFSDNVDIYDVRKENKETLYYKNKESSIQEEYNATLDIVELKAIVETCSEEFITFRFGDSQAFLLCREGIVNVIPEIHPLG